MLFSLISGLSLNVFPEELSWTTALLMVCPTHCLCIFNYSYRFSSNCVVKSAVSLGTNLGQLPSILNKFLNLTETWFSYL